jgi:hypothetical protein
MFFLRPYIILELTLSRLLLHVIDKATKEAANLTCEYLG